MGRDPAGIAGSGVMPAFRVGRGVAILTVAMRSGRTQITAICIVAPCQNLNSTPAPIGSSARGYQESVIPLADLTAADQAGGRAVCLCAARAGRECPLTCIAA